MIYLNFKVVKRVNGFHLKRCPDKLVDMDKQLQPPVSESSDPGVEHPHTETGDHRVEDQETSNLRSPSESPHNDSQESIPPLPPPMPH